MCNCEKNNVDYKVGMLYDIHNNVIEYVPKPGQPVIQKLGHVIVQGVFDSVDGQFIPEEIIRFSIPIVKQHITENDTTVVKVFRDVDPFELLEKGEFEDGTLIEILDENDDPIQELLGNLEDPRGLFYVGYPNLSTFYEKLEHEADGNMSKEEEIERLRSLGLDVDDIDQDDIDNWDEDLEFIPVQFLLAYTMNYANVLPIAKKIIAQSKESE